MQIHNIYTWNTLAVRLSRNTVPVRGSFGHTHNHAFCRPELYSDTVTMDLDEPVPPYSNVRVRFYIDDVDELCLLEFNSTRSFHTVLDIMAYVVECVDIALTNNSVLCALEEIGTPTSASMDSERCYRTVDDSVSYAFVAFLDT